MPGGQTEYPRDEDKLPLGMSFAEARRDPLLIRGQDKPDTLVNCDSYAVRQPEGDVGVSLTRSRYGSRGYLSLHTGTIRANVFADFIESADRQERIFLLTYVIPQNRASKDFRLDSELVREMADLIQSLHVRCYTTNLGTPTAFVLVSPTIVYY